MQLLESGQMYLESILILSKERTNIRSVDVSEYMGFTKPSVSRAIGLLKSGGYITVDTDGYITLTEAGAEVAHKMYDRHSLLTEFFVSLCVSSETAANDACKIEHHISDETFEERKKHVTKSFLSNPNKRVCFANINLQNTPVLLLKT